MNKELIKKELENEINSIIKSNNDTFNVSSKLKMWSTKLSGVEDFGEVISKKLNQILEKHNIKFKDENEKNELISFLNPTIKQLMIKNIRK